MGDVVLGELINEILRASEAMLKAIASARAIDVYVVIARKSAAPMPSGTSSNLRDGWLSCRLPALSDESRPAIPSRRGCGRSACDSLRRRVATGESENLTTREESLIDHRALLDSVTKFFNMPGSV